MTSATVGREAIQIVEIIQPFCANIFGQAPCTATGDDDTKCYNTRSTCQDTANWNASTLSLFFSSGDVAEQRVKGAPYIIPSLQSVSTSPSKMNYAAASPDAQGLGNRARCTVVFADHPHTDQIVDPYLSGRSWTPYDKARGSFWTRWLARNLYRKNVQFNVYEGYAGQPLNAMLKRTYFLEKASSIDSNGRVTLMGKDVLARIEERKAQAPAASPGKLKLAISATQTAMDVANAVASEYPSSGLLRINDELLRYTGTADGAQALLFTGLTRGVLGTTAEAHGVDDGVQICIEYTQASINTVLSDLMTTYGGIDATWLDTTEWANEISDYRSPYKLSAVISEPTSVYKLVSEISEQTLVNIWWDDRAGLVKIKPVRGFVNKPETLSDEKNVISSTLKVVDLPRERVSQVWTYYSLRTKISDSQKVESYLNQFVLADLESETDDLYGAPSIRKIYSRWMTSEPLIRYTARIILNNYATVPQQISFSMDAKDRDYWVGDAFFMSHYLDVDEFGNRRERLWTIISAEESVPGEIVSYVAIETDNLGKLHFIMPTGSADYPGYDVAPVKNCYIGNYDGLLSDGQTAGIIR